MPWTKFSSFRKIYTPVSRLYIGNVKKKIFAFFKPPFNENPTIDNRCAQITYLLSTWQIQVPNVVKGSNGTKFPTSHNFFSKSQIEG